MLGVEHYRLTVDETAEFFPIPSSWGRPPGPDSKGLSQRRLLHTREAVEKSRQQQFCCVISLLEHFPVDQHTKIIQEQVKIMSEVSNKGVASVVTAAANL